MKENNGNEKPNIIWHSGDVEKALSAKPNLVWQATGVSIDSRSVKKGDLFIAIKGDNFNGHEYVKAAFEAGASAAIVSEIPVGIDTNHFPVIVVKDTLVALQDLARYRRENFKGKVISVTGSVGKTSTKEMLLIALSAYGKVYGTTGNLNNHIGLPLTIARMSIDTDYAVLEMGMNHAGEIAFLSKIAKPHIAIITCVEAVHLEFFNSVAEIADAKSEIFEGCDKNSVAVLNFDNSYFYRIEKNVKKYEISNVIKFGSIQGSDVRLVSYDVEGRDSYVEVLLNEDKDQEELIEYKIAAPGKHLVMNSLSVVATLKALSVNLKEGADKLKEFTTAKGRGNTIVVQTKSKDFTIIDDSYNASPASVAASLELLSSMKKNNSKAIAVLGDMFELGEGAPEIHRDLKNVIEKNKIDYIFTSGNLMKNLYDSLSPSIQGGHCDNSDKIVKDILDKVCSGDVVLVKGSRGMKMEKVVEGLKSIEG